MKAYVLMTSLTLAAGAGVGYWTGKGSAQTGFADGCSARGVVVVYDYQSEEHRHFHCFELDTETPAEPEWSPPVNRFESKARFEL